MLNNKVKYLEYSKLYPKILWKNFNIISKVTVKFEAKINFIVSKNSSGVATDFKILVNTIINIKINSKNHDLKFSESINIKNNSDSYEQSKYERNIKKNFASSVREKLIIKIFNLNDN